MRTALICLLAALALSAARCSKPCPEQRHRAAQDASDTLYPGATDRDSLEIIYSPDQL